MSLTDNALDTFHAAKIAFAQAQPMAPSPTHRICWFGNPWECGALAQALTHLGGVAMPEAPQSAIFKKMAERLDLRPYAVRKTFMGMYRGVLIFETATGGGFTWADVDAEGTDQ